MLGLVCKNGGSGEVNWLLSRYLIDRGRARERGRERVSVKQP